MSLHLQVNREVLKQFSMFFWSFSFCGLICLTTVSSLSYNKSSSRCNNGSSGNSSGSSVVVAVVVVVALLMLAAVVVVILVAAVAEVELVPY